MPFGSKKKDKPPAEKKESKKEKKLREKAEKASQKDVDRAEANKVFEASVAGSPLTKAEVHARIVSSKEVELFPLTPGGTVKLRYAYVCQRGYYPEDLYKANQDAFKIVPEFNGEPNNILFGVFDGHGSDGDGCSYYVRDMIEAELKKQMKLEPNDFEKAYRSTFLSLGESIHTSSIDDQMSGTTAIAAFFRGQNITIANIGDSRAIVGERKGKRVMAYSLSIDQTPYRADERERVKACGAVVMSIDMLEGVIPYHEDWGCARAPCPLASSADAPSPPGDSPGDSRVAVMMRPASKHSTPTQHAARDTRRPTRLRVQATAAAVPPTCVATSLPTGRRRPAAAGRHCHPTRVKSPVPPLTCCVPRLPACAA